MSFILDALKKSETERARQNGPALLETRVLPPRRGVPAWAIVVGVILAANVALLLWVVLRTPQAPTAPVTAAPPPQPAATASATPAPAAPAPTAAPPPAVAQSAPPPAPVTPPVAEPPVTGPPASPPTAAAVVNPADYAPARPPPAVPRAAPPPVASTTDSGLGLDPTLPTASDLTASGSGLPPLRLALHAYDADPANRYVLINSQRLREGETTSEGARVERIAPEGVLMSWRGQRFRLLPGG